MFHRKDSTIAHRIPDILQNIPFADKEGIVLRSKYVNLKGPHHAYNASLVWDEAHSRHLLFFREDLEGPTRAHTGGARIGVAVLDKDLNQDGPVHYPSLLGFENRDKHRQNFEIVEDPRAFFHQGKLYVLYCSRGMSDKKILRPMLAELTEDLETKSYRCLSADYRTKNWTPLIKDLNLNAEAPSGEHITFIERLFPLAHAKLDPASDVTIMPAIEKIEGTTSEVGHWTWGHISGGTHAQQLPNGQFLCFFHSWFFFEERRAYVMGALLLEEAFPHRPIAVSPYPILWNGIYGNKVNGTLGPVFQESWQPMLDRVIFPCGFVINSDKEGKQILHLSCGENDNSIVLVDMDLKELLASLQPLA